MVGLLPQIDEISIGVRKPSRERAAKGPPLPTVRFIKFDAQSLFWTHLKAPCHYNRRMFKSVGLGEKDISRWEFHPLTAEPPARSPPIL